MKSSFLLSLLFTVVVLLLVVPSTTIDAFPVWAGVRRSAAELAVDAQRTTFASSVVSALVNMLMSTSTSSSPQQQDEIRTQLINAIGRVETVDVAEVNDTFTNVHLDCEKQSTADAVIEAANTVSWNAIKAADIALASTEGPQAETQGARTVVFFAIVTIVAVVCAGLASWCVRRRAIEKHRGISFTDLAGLEEELYRRQEENVVSGNNNNNNNNNAFSVNVGSKQQQKSGSGGAAVSSSSNNLRKNNNNSASSNNFSSPQKTTNSGTRGGGGNGPSTKRR